MSHSKKSKSPTTELKDDIDVDDELSSKIIRGLHVDDFVGIENISSELPASEHLGNSSETDAEAVNIAQHVTNIQSSKTAEESRLEFNVVDTNSPTEWEKGLLVEQQYWEQNGPIIQRENNSKTKYCASQRLTIRQLNNIAYSKAADRDPSSFKFDVSTTATLKTLIEKHYLGPLHNVVSNGKNTVIIHASCSVSPLSFRNGKAVKVYKLTNDSKKNIVILKRAHREYKHLTMLQRSGNIQYAVHKMKNVLIFGFIGDNQETAPSITKLPSEHFTKAYQMIVNDVDKWYNKYRIIHGNICSKNILFVEARESYHYVPFYLYFIGWGHSVQRDHPQALIKLMRDCHFVSNFFRRRNVPAMSTEELFKDITGLHKISSKVLESIRDKDLWQDGLLTNPNR